MIRIAAIPITITRPSKMKRRLSVMFYDSHSNCSCHHVLKFKLGLHRAYKHNPELAADHFESCNCKFAAEEERP